MVERVEREKSSTCLTTCIYQICTIIKSVFGRHVDENAEKPEFLYISGGSVQQFRHFGKEFGNSSKR